MHFDGPLTSLLWHKLLNLVLEFLGSGQELLLDGLGFETEKSNVSHSWQVAGKVALLVLEEIQDVHQRVDWICKVFVHNDIDIELLVSPVNFQKRLESGQELICFVVGSGHDLFYLLLAFNLDWVVADPGCWVQILGV